MGDAASEARKLALLQNAQQFDLSVLAQFADFIEEERAVTSFFQVSRAALQRSGERSLFIAEEFGLDQRFGNGAAGNRDEPAVLSRGHPANEWHGRSVPFPYRFRR